MSDRGMMNNMIGTTVAATLIGLGAWMLVRQFADEETDTLMAGADDMDSMSEGRRHGIAGEWREKVMEGTRSAGGRVDSYVSDSPLVAGIAALALGAMAGAVIPESSREHELFGDARDRLADKAREAAQDAVSRGRDMVGNAVQTATESIKQQAKGGDGRSDRNVGIQQDAEI